LQTMQYGGTFSLSATASSGRWSHSQPPGHAQPADHDRVGLCTITASAPATSTYSAARSRNRSASPGGHQGDGSQPTIAYGAQIPTLTYTLSGFVNMIHFGGERHSGIVHDGYCHKHRRQLPDHGIDRHVGRNELFLLFVPGTLTIQPASQAR